MRMRLKSGLTGNVSMYCSIGWKMAGAPLVMVTPSAIMVSTNGLVSSAA